MLDSININSINEVARKAGDAILDIYHNSDFSQVVDFKEDNSPLTLADQASHNVIVKELENLYPDIPIISEEGENVTYEERKNWEYYWLIDPLDGTKEFIKRNGEFTVNIALIHKNTPILGVIYVPVTEVMYYGKTNGTAFKQEGGETPNQLTVNRKTSNRIAVRSKSHASPEEEGVLEKYDAKDFISVGSSLKFCMVAEGKADIYYRHGPTMEWDTAAGQAVVVAAGARVYTGNTEENTFVYNRENMLNGSFLVLGF